MMLEQTRGRAHVDDGAALALRGGGASLLPIGVVRVEGEFDRGALLAVVGPDGADIAHGLSSYDADDARRLCRIRSSRIIELLGYSYGDALIHRNNMVLLR
jgi:glutamate 5-kinase